MSGQAARRADNVANEMGKLLLQGYKMLDRSCPNCHSVLLQDKQGLCFCVACETCKNLDGKADEPNEMETNDNKSADTNAEFRELTQVHKPLINATEILMQEIISSANELHLSTGTLSIPEKSTYVTYINSCAKAITAIQNVKTIEYK